MPTKRKSGAAARDAKTTAASPEWLTKTPAGKPELNLFDSGGDGIESISVTRAEYVAMKEHLARLRGLLPDPKAEARKAIKTAAQMIDENLRTDFGAFMAVATPAEKMFLSNVFRDHASDYQVNDRHQIGIAGAFMCALTNDADQIVYDRGEIETLREFWLSFHTKEPGLEKLLKFLETAKPEQRELIGRVLDLEEFYQQRHLKAVLDALDRHTGFTSPAEEFLLDCLHGYYNDPAFTPEHVRVKLEQFQENYSMTIATARDMLARYQSDVKGQQAPATAGGSNHA